MSRDGGLDVDHSWQLLHTVDENVALLDGRLVLSVLRVGSGGDDNSPDFVNLAVQPTIGNELGKLPAILKMFRTEGKYRFWSLCDTCPCNLPWRRKHLRCRWAWDCGTIPAAARMPWSSSLWHKKRSGGSSIWKTPSTVIIAECFCHSGLPYLPVCLGNLLYPSQVCEEVWVVAIVKCHEVCLEWRLSVSSSTNRPKRHFDTNMTWQHIYGAVMKNKQMG